MERTRVALPSHFSFPYRWPMGRLPLLPPPPLFTHSPSINRPAGPGCIWIYRTYPCLLLGFRPYNTTRGLYSSISLRIFFPPFIFFPGRSQFLPFSIGFPLFFLRNHLALLGQLCLPYCRCPQHNTELQDPWPQFYPLPSPSPCNALLRHACPLLSLRNCYVCYVYVTLGERREHYSVTGYSLSCNTFDLDPVGDQRDGTRLMINCRNVKTEG